MAACGAGLTRRTSVRGVVLGALGWLLRLSLVLGRGEPSPKTGQGAGSPSSRTDERAARRLLGLRCLKIMKPARSSIVAAGASTQAYETPRCRYNHAYQRPRTTGHIDRPRRRGSRPARALGGRHREHPRHGTAKLPPITACPLEPTPRPFAPLNDRARQRMRAASTLDVTTGTTTDIQQSLRAAPRAPP